MTLQTWLQRATKSLGDHNIMTARLDALVLLEDALGKDKAWILANPYIDLDTQTMQQLDEQIQRRAKHEPLAYIRGKSEFYGRTFLVTPATLQPRPETETMIEQLLKLVESRKLKVESGLQIADIGTGSGAIAITAKLELPRAVVYGTDIQAGALAVAQHNAQALGAEVAFYQGNLLNPLPGLSTQHSVLLCNLPYVPNSHTINQAAMQEPSVAIFGGEDGLDLYREMFDQITQRDQKPQYILTESLPFQHKDLAEIAKQSGYGLAKTEDFIQVFTLERTV